MAKPIIYNLKAMSCEEENTITFSYSGGLIKSVTLAVRTASNNTLVYTGTYVTAKEKYILPANSINVATYGTQYYIQIKVTENDDTESAWSDTKFAVFIRTPSFVFSDVTEGMQVHQSYLNTELTYSQSDGEPLQEYAFYLYDFSKELLTNSPVKYDLTDMNYVFNGLTDGAYYVRGMGTTVHGYQVDTGFVQIIVSYIFPEVYTTLLLKNDNKGGYISYETNIISITYTGEDTFEFVDGMIDLTSKEIYYDQGYYIPEDVTFIVKGRDMLESNKVYFEVYDAEKHRGFYITCYVYDDGRIRYKLIGKGDLSDYILYSPAVSANANDIISFWIRREGGLYLFKLFKNGEAVS